MITITNNKTNLLRNALRGNGIFSGLSGILAILGAGAITEFVGAGNALIFIILGLNLAVFSGLLFYFTMHESVDLRFAWFAVVADAIWVVGSFVILVTDVFSLTTDGKLMVFFIADIVLVFAFTQYIGIQQTN